MKEAQCSTDMAQVAVCRQKLNLEGQTVQWPWILGRIKRLQLGADRQAALIGVLAGDAVPEVTAARWNGSQDRCRCGMVEDIHHRWWVCHRRQGLRLRIMLGVPLAEQRRLPRCTKEFGIPVELPEITQ